MFNDIYDVPKNNKPLPTEFEFYTPMTTPRSLHHRYSKDEVQLTNTDVFTSASSSVDQSNYDNRIEQIDKWLIYILNTNNFIQINN